MLGAIMTQQSRQQAGRGVTLAGTVAAGIDRLNTWVGHGVAWLTLIMVLVTFVVVVLRYFLDTGWIWLQELTVWMHAMVFLLGAAYTLRAGDHVRVDVFYRRMSDRGQAWVDLAGVLLLLLPFCGFLMWTASGYVADAWLRHEGSREAGGLPYPFVPLLKSAMLAMAVMLALQGLSQLTNAVLRLAGHAPPADEDQDPASAAP